MIGEPGDRTDESGQPDEGLAVVYRLPTSRATPAAVGSDPAEPAADPDGGSPVAVADHGLEFGGGGGGGAAAPGAAADQDDVGDSVDEGQREDWAWVREWRAGQEPTPWITGVPLAVFSALLVAVAIWVLSAGLSDRPVVAVLVNLLVAGGLTPAMWLSRNLPVLRWIAAGAAAGIIIGWVSAILMLPMPAA